MKIQRLDDELARKIAAGEVIERPASVVKELVENALDAKSESINVALFDGGIKMIVVRDDGDGMDADDLRLCVGRHTTSKIVREEDLSHIETLGFRGEALASISAVSRLRIVTRAEEEETAYELRATAGVSEDIIPAARAKGTTVEVSDLFFNLPARARFLASSRSEFFHCNRIIHRLAACSTAVGFVLSHGERNVFSAPSVNDLRERIGQLYGAQIARQMIPIAADKDGVSIHGYVSSPEVRRGNRRDQIFAVNGRPVEDRGLAYTLATAYRGLLRPGMYPLAVIAIGIAPEEVDVNIHPRKLEVRFSRQHAVQETLTRALQDALSTRYIVPSLSSSDYGRAYGGTRDAARVEGAGLHLELQRKASVQKAVYPEEKVRVEGKRCVIGQLQNTYILVETSDGLEIVDQHIAHERILYESLLHQFESGNISQQRFLLPVRVELPFESANVLMSEKDKLIELGIDLDEFGGGTFLVRGYPSILVKSQSQYGFNELIEKIVDQLVGGVEVKKSLFDHLIAELACGAAIKAGARLPFDEQQELVDRLMALDNPYTCPHGRPIIFRVTREELDRRFKRH